MGVMKNTPPILTPGRGPWYVAAAAMLFATAGIASRLAPAGAPAAQFGVARLLIGGIVLAAYLGPRAIAGVFPVLPRVPLALAAIAMALFQWSYFAAIDGAGVGVATLISAATSPVVADAMAAACDARRPLWNCLAGACLMALGVSCIAQADGVTATGIAVALLSGAAYAGYTGCTAKLEKSRAGGGLASTALALVSSGLVLLPAARTELLAMFSLAGLLVALYLGIGATALAYALLVTGLKQVSAASALAILMLQPLAAVLLGAAVLGESMNALTLVGMALIAIAHALRVFNQ